MRNRLSCCVLSGNSHNRNLANNSWGRGGDYGLGTLFYKGVKFERGENWSHKTQVFHFLSSVYFLFVIIQVSNQKMRVGLCRGHIRYVEYVSVVL
jgi:hypothetical protein